MGSRRGRRAETEAQRGFAKPKASDIIPKLPPGGTKKDEGGFAARATPLRLHFFSTASA